MSHPVELCLGWLEGGRWVSRTLPGAGGALAPPGGKSPQVEGDEGELRGCGRDDGMRERGEKREQ